MALPSVNPEAPRGERGRTGVADRRGWRPVAAPLAWAAGALLLSRLPACLAVVPALGVLRGPMGLVLAALAAGVALAAAGPRPRVRAPRPGVLLVAGWAFLVLVGLAYTTRLRVSGDEPHYLLMAQSLWREGDLDLRDNLAREDWREYTPGPMAPHFGAPRADGRPFPAHSPGLPVLLAPLYALGGRSLCVIALTLAAAALGLEMFRAGRRWTGDDEAALLAWALALLPPVSFYAFLVYTEVPAALALAVALRLLVEPSPSGVAASSGTGVTRPGRETARAALAALLASALPWLHLKMMPAAAALALVAVVRLRGRPRAAFVMTAALMGVGFLLYYHAIFGIPSPLAIYGGVPRDADGSPLRALAGLLLDRSFGLLPYAPVFLLALAGLAGRARQGGWAVLLVGAAVIGPVLPWRMWWGGQCPPARFLVPLVPVLGTALAARVAGSRRGLARWRWALVALGLAATIGMTLRPAALLLLNRGDRPTRLWVALSGERAVGSYLPSLVAPSPDDVRIAIVWAIAVGLVLLLDALARRRDRVDRLFRGLGLPVVLLLAAGIAVDGWARREPPGVSSEGRPDVDPD